LWQNVYNFLLNSKKKTFILYFDIGIQCWRWVEALDVTLSIRYAFPPLVGSAFGDFDIVDA